MTKGQQQIRKGIRAEKAKMASQFLDAAGPFRRITTLLAKIEENGLIVGEKGESKEEAAGACGLAIGQVAIFHQAVITELAMKALVALERPEGIPEKAPRDNPTAVPYTHDIKFLFGKLNQSTQERISADYQETAEAYSKLLAKEGQKFANKGNAAQVVALDTFWRWVEDTVMNFKYDPYPAGDIIPCGVMWDTASETMWVGLSKLPSFPKILLDYARDRVKDRGAAQHSAPD